MLQTLVPRELEMLKRQDPIPLEIAEADEFRLERAKQVRDLLGYNALHERVQKEVKAGCTVEQALLELGIKIFCPTSVAAYQKQMVKKDRPKGWLKPIPGFSVERGVGSLCFGVTLILTFVSLLMTLITLGCALAGVNGSSYWYSLCSAIGVVGFFGALVLIGGCLSAEYDPAKWVKVPLRGYDEAVPDYALATALAIKEKFPGAEFLVETFQPGRLLLKDPFLICRVGGRDYYLEVWQEPDFNEQRLV